MKKFMIMYIVKCGDNYYPKKNYAGKKCPHTFYEYNAIGL